MFKSALKPRFSGFQIRLYSGFSSEKVLTKKDFCSRWKGEMRRGKELPFNITTCLEPHCFEWSSPHHVYSRGINGIWLNQCFVSPISHLVHDFETHSQWLQQSTEWYLSFPSELGTMKDVSLELFPVSCHYEERIWVRIMPTQRQRQDEQE